MSVYRRQRRASLKTDLDRRLWSGLDKVNFNVHVKGDGQHLMPYPIFFGQAFDQPPAFNYSAATDEAVVSASLAKSLVRLHPDLTAAHEPTSEYGDTLASQGLFVDGSFEHQMIFDDPVIPVINQSEFQKIYSEQYSGTTYPLRPGTNTNGWVQGFETNSRWAVSSDKHYPAVSPDREGQYSAKYVFDVDGASRWLYPTMGANHVPAWGYHSGSEDQQRFEVASHLLSVGTQFDGGLGYVQGPSVNPSANTYTYQIRLWSSHEGTLEFDWAGWDYYGFYNVGTDQDYFAGDPTWGGTVRVIEETSETRKVVAGEWLTYTFDVRWPHWPNAPVDPTVLEDAGGLSQLILKPGWRADSPAYATLRFRVTDGVAGQEIYIDDAVGYLNLNTVTANTMLTIGVAEWIRDEKGMYVGARLWFRTATEGDFLAS